MRLSFVYLKNVCNVNDYTEVDKLELQAGNPGEIYIQLVDLDKPQECGFLRYIPASGATVTAKFNHIDSNAVINRAAVQQFAADDRSIFKIPVLATDRIAPNSLTLTLTEGANVYTIKATGELVVSSQDSQRYFC